LAVRGVSHTPLYIFFCFTACSLKSNKPERKILFKRARERYDFSEYAIHSYNTKLRYSWISDHIDSNTAQKLATRAYKAAEKVLFGQAKPDALFSIQLSYKLLV
jgi:hypothetical protein